MHEERVPMVARHGDQIYVFSSLGCERSLGALTLSQAGELAIRLREALGLYGESVAGAAAAAGLAAFQVMEERDKSPEYVSTEEIIDLMRALWFELQHAPGVHPRYLRGAFYELMRRTQWMIEALEDELAEEKLVDVESELDELAARVAKLAEEREDYRTEANHIQDWEYGYEGAYGEDGEPCCPHDPGCAVHDFIGDEVGKCNCDYHDGAYDEPYCSPKSLPNKEPVLIPSIFIPFFDPSRYQGKDNPYADEAPKEPPVREHPCGADLGELPQDVRTPSQEDFNRGDYRVPPPVQRGDQLLCPGECTCSPEETVNSRGAPLGQTSHYERRDDGFYVVWGADFPEDLIGEREAFPSEAHHLALLDERTQTTYLDLRTRAHPLPWGVNELGRCPRCDTFIEPKLSVPTSGAAHSCSDLDLGPGC